MLAVLGEQVPGANSDEAVGQTRGFAGKTGRAPAKGAKRFTSYGVGSPSMAAQVETNMLQSLSRGS